MNVNRGDQDYGLRPGSSDMREKDIKERNNKSSDMTSVNREAANMQKTEAGKVRMLDMHAHLLCLSEEYREKLTKQEMSVLAREELVLRRASGIDTVFSCGTPGEWDLMERCLAEAEAEIRPESGDFLSFGIHPWYSDRFNPRDCRRYFEKCRIIGEIGMDSVWTAVPLAIQRRVFARQLEIAAELGKPVILHTKGQEMQIAEMICDFPGKVCVHWYSGDMAALEKFLEADCFFTLGPDLAKKLDENCGKQNVQGSRTDLYLSSVRTDGTAALYLRMLREVPADRLFFETDGVSSIAWMRGQDAGAVSFREIPEVLDRNLNCAAGRMRIPPETLLAGIQENFRKFLS